MRWAAHSGDIVELAFVSFAAAALSHSSAFADVPGRANAGVLSTMLGWLSTQLIVPATVLAASLLAFLVVRALVARRRRALLGAKAPARYAPYALPARVSVALAAAARARK